MERSLEASLTWLDDRNSGLNLRPTRRLWLPARRFARAATGGAGMDTTLTLIDLGGSVALLLWGVHMLQSGIQPCCG
jgi:hypothetical protein